MLKLDILFIVFSREKESIPRLLFVFTFAMTDGNPESILKNIDGFGDGNERKVGEFGVDGSEDSNEKWIGSRVRKCEK